MLNRLELRVPLELRERLERLAAADGKPLTEFCRDVLDRHVCDNVIALREQYRREAERSLRAARSLDHKSERNRRRPENADEVRAGG